jgi:CO/xanthine dehydrogenase Mo-binding subunit
MWGVDVADVAWGDGEAICLDPAKDNQRLPIGKIAARMNNTGGPISAEASVNPHDYLPAFGVHICDTEVDPETGQTTVIRYTAIQDVGRAIHADYCEGQIQGGAVQGIGWALNEAFIHNKAGQLDNPGFLDYRMPVCSDLPMIDTVMVEKPNPAHPYGVKGVGEVPIVPPLATVANAVSRAAGVRIRDLPLSPDRVYSAIKSKG